MQRGGRSRMDWHRGRSRSSNPAMSALGYDRQLRPQSPGHIPERLPTCED